MNKKIGMLLLKGFKKIAFILDIKQDRIKQIIKKAFNKPLNHRRALFLSAILNGDSQRIISCNMKTTIEDVRKNTDWLVDNGYIELGRFIK